MSERPDLGEGLFAISKRIVLWNAAVLGDAQNLAGRIKRVLCAGSVAPVTGCEEDVALGSEDNARAKMYTAVGGFLHGEEVF